MAWAPPPLDQRQLMTLMLAQQGIQGLGESFIRGDAMRRGAPVPRSTLPDPMHQMMQFQQMQQAEQQRSAAKAAIGGLKTVPDDLKTLMSLYPEESIKPYIQGQLRPDRQQQDIWSSPAGLYSRSAGGIIPGTGPPPKEPGPPVVKEFDIGDRKEMRQWNGQSWEPIPGANAPRWQPDKPGGGAAGLGAALAPYLGMMENKIIDEDTGEEVTQKQFFGALRQKGVMPSPQPIGKPIETGRAVSKAAEKYAETQGIIDTAKSSLETLKEYQPTIVDKAANAMGMPGPKGAAADSANQALLFSVAKLAEQGALQAPDKAVAEAMIGAVRDPRLTEAARRAKISEFEKWLESRTKGNVAKLAGRPVPGASPAQAPAPTATTGLKSILRKADFDALPSGAEFIAPDGSRRRKP